MKAGKLKAKEVKDFLNASYDKTPPKDLDGYILDNKLSTDTAKVYYNPQTNHAVIAHRGTKGTLDWGNNLAYALGAYEMTPRYWKGKSVQDKAEKKYGKQNISTLGHSQGAILARKLGSDTKEVINVNPAYTFERPKNNEYNIRSSTDVVSGLYAPVSKAREVLYPEYSKKHDITIPSQSATDVLGEHSYEILDRMGDAEIGVGAGNKFSSNSIMKSGGRRAKALGYQSDDIDWCGSGHFFSRDRRRVEPAPPSREDLEEIIEDINDELQYFQGRERYERMNGLPADEDREERIRDLEISRAIALNLIDNLTPGTTPVSSIRSSNFELSEEDDYTPFSFEMSEETPSVAFYNNGTEMPSPMYSSDEEMEGRGLQGTPYLNQGTNPFGTRGAGFHDGHSSVDKYFKPPKGLRRGQGRIRGGVRGSRSYANLQNLVANLQNRMAQLGEFLGEQFDEHGFDDEIEDIQTDLEQMYTAQEAGNIQEAEQIATSVIEQLQGMNKELNVIERRMTIHEISESEEEEESSDEEEQEEGEGGMRGGANIEDIVSFVKMMKRKKNTTDEIRGLVNEMESQFGVANNPAVLETLNELYTELVEASRPFIRPDESSSDEEIEEGEGGKRSGLKSLQKGFTKMGTAFGKAGEAMNPMSYAIKDKGTRGAMVSSGDVTQNYLLPATVSAGKPIYDATAMTASTMLTGNPVLGKAVADSLWDNMVAKKGYDPRERQKSQELGELSGTFGQAVSKPYSASLGGKRDNRIDLDNEFNLRDRQRRGFRIRRPPQPPVSTEPLTTEEINEIFGTALQNEATEAAGRGRMKGGSTDALMKVALMVGVPLAALAGCVTVGQIHDLIQEYRGRNQVVPQQEEFKDAMPDIEEGGRRKKGGVRIRGINRIKGLEDFPIEDLTIPTLESNLEETKNDIDPIIKPMLETIKKNNIQLGRLLNNKNDTEETKKEREDLIKRQDKLMNRVSELEWLKENDERKLKKSEDFVKKLDKSSGLKGFTDIRTGKTIYGEGRNVDFDKIKWGSFTRMFNKYKKEHPKARVKDLEQFAKRIIKNKKEFSDKALKKAMFYLNVIKKG